jgi:hypothetical protein
MRICERLCMYCVSQKKVNLNIVIHPEGCLE